LPNRTVYWDACTFLGLINREPGKVDATTEVWREAERGETSIITSTFTLAEVFKAKCEGKQKPFPEADDAKVLQLLTQKWVTTIVVDQRIATAARRLLRRHPECKKPTDAIHLASALQMNVDEMHTFDEVDLLRLDGKVNRQDRQPLKICKPSAAPKPAPAPMPLFEGQGS
jgi:predicted nucleic acid-binding protein